MLWTERLMSTSKKTNGAITKTEIGIRTQTARTQQNDSNQDILLNSDFKY